MKSQNKKLKCQFHAHCNGDPIDHISHSPKKLIDEAAKLNYDVLSITCHRKIIFTKSLENHAKKKGILLIPGIEFEIEKKHILCINAHPDIYEVKSFEDLKNYKDKHQNCLIIAPHPYFPGPGLKDDLEKNIQLFDAIEISWAYTKSKNYNEKALQIANKHKVPTLSTADCHILSYLDIGYFKIKSPKNIAQIFNNIKTGEIENFHKATSLKKIIYSLGSIIIKTKLRKFAQLAASFYNQPDATVPQKNSSTGAQKSSKNCAARIL